MKQDIPKRFEDYSEKDLKRLAKKEQADLEKVKLEKREQRKMVIKAWKTKHKDFPELISRELHKEKFYRKSKETVEDHLLRALRMLSAPVISKPIIRAATQLDILL